MGWWRPDAKQLASFEERLSKMERDLRSGLLDAEDLYEKARRILGRTSKRAALDAAPAEEGPPPGMDPISWSIHKRRMRGRAPLNGG